MKRTVSIALMLIFAVASLSVFSTGAQATGVAAKYDENLVAWYNFEGANEAEWYADKAPAGAYADVVQANGVTVEDGVLSIPSTAKACLLFPTDASSDFSDMNGKTVFLSFNASGNATTYNCDILAIRNFYRYWLLKGTTDNNYSFGGGINASPTVEGYKLNSNVMNPTAPVGRFYYIAITIELKNGELTATNYNSADGITYCSTVSSFGTSVSPKTSIREWMCIGKAHAGVDDRGISYKIGEIRVYNKVMSAEEVAELASIKPCSTETVTLETLPPETTPEPTTEPPLVTQPPIITVAPSDTIDYPEEITAGITYTEETTEPSSDTAGNTAATEPSGGCQGTVLFLLTAIAALPTAVIIKKRR